VRTRRSDSSALIGTSRLRGRLRRVSRPAAVSLGLLAAGALVMSAGVASAAPTAPAASKPTVSQLQAKLQKLSTQADAIDEQLDQYQQEENSASQRLAALNNQLARYQNQFKSLRAEVAQIATAAYEQGSINSPEALLTTNNPQQILDQSSILLELSASNSHQMTQFLNTARQITNNQQAAKRTKDGIAALKAKEEAKKKQNDSVTAQTKSALAALTPAQQEGTMPGSSGGQTVAQDPLPDSTQGEQAVKFAYAQLGCEYVFGGTGPCDQGFDCSGLTQAAWASAGVSIERTSEDQWDSLPHVSTSDLEPGDILEFDGEGHVGIYVGSGWLIDAPHTGAVVEKVQLSGWYTENLDGALRP
jgi:cell wall-associated NlpC family hydrolase